MDVPLFLARLDSSWMLLAGVVILTTVMIRMSYRRRGSPNAGRRIRPAGPSSPQESSTAYRELLARLDSKEAEFYELSREAIARLDNKIAVLQKLLAESEMVIARLESASRSPSHAARD